MLRLQLPFVTFGRGSIFDVRTSCLVKLNTGLFKFFLELGGVKGV